MTRRATEIPPEPVSGELLDLLERSRLLEKMRRARNDLELHVCVHLAHGVAIHLDHRLIVSTDDQEGRSLDAWKRVACQIRTPAAGHDSTDRCRPLGCGDQCGGSAGTGTEAADREIPKVGLPARPVSGGTDAWAEALDVEAILPRPHVDRFFPGREQVEQQRRETLAVEELGHLAVPRTEAAAAAAVREDDQTARTERDSKIPVQGGRAGGNLNRMSSDDSHGVEFSRQSSSGLRCQPRSGMRQGLDHHVVGDLREVLEELTHGIEVLRRAQTHHLVSLGLHPRERCRRCDANRNHDPAWLARPHRADCRQHGRPGCDPVVDDDDHAPGRVEGPLRTRVEHPPLAEDFLLNADFFTQVLVGRDVEIEAFQDGTRLVERANRQFRLSWRPQFSYKNDIQVSAERIGNDSGHRHGTARYAEHQRMLSAIMRKAAGELVCRLFTVLEAHDIDSHLDRSEEAIGPPRKGKWPGDCIREIAVREERADVDQVTVFAGPASVRLGGEVCEKLEVAPAAYECRRFPDGEMQIELQDPVGGRDVYLLQSTSPPVERHVMELLLLADACRRAGASRLTAMIPYLGYARQDRRTDRRSLGARVMANVIATAGLDRLMLIDAHSSAIEGFFDMPIEHLSAVPLLARAAAPSMRESSVVVAPDLGAVRRAREYARRLQVPMAFVHKTRLSGENVETHGVIGDVQNRSPLIVDDMLSTGGTIAAAIDALRAAGAIEPIFVAVTHALLVGRAREVLRGLPIARLLVGDTVPIEAPAVSQLEVTSVAPLVATAIRRAFRNESLADLCVLA